ncbi:unnamed protein product, partial [Oppiella nova]
MENQDINNESNPSKKALKKQQKAADKALKKSERAEARNDTKIGEEGDAEDVSRGMYGVSPMIRSSDRPKRQLVAVKDVNKSLDNKTIWLRGRLHT